MKIKQKLSAGFLFVSILIFGFSFGINFLVQEKTFSIFQEVGGERLPGDIALSRMTTELYHTVVLLDRYEKNPDIRIRIEMEKALASLDAHKTTYKLYYKNNELSSQIERLIQIFTREVARYGLLLQKGSNNEDVFTTRKNIDTLLEQFAQSLNPSIDKSIATSYQKIINVQEMNNYSHKILLVGGAVILILTLLLSLYIAHLFSTPLKSLRDAALEIGEGRLNVKLPVNSKDEIGDLAQAFNKMTGELETTRKKLMKEHVTLQKHRNHLKELVDARTVELRKLTRAVEQSHSTIIITDLDANIEFVNPAFTQTSGYKKEEALEQNPRILQSGNHDTAFFKSMWDTLKQGEIWKGEIQNKRKNGSLYWEATTISPMRDETGKITHYLAIQDDITARKEIDLALEQSHQQLAKAKEAAECANKSKSEFLSNMSHELRTPMNAIIGFAQMLEYDEDLNEEQQDYTHEILKAGNHLLELINGVLDLAKIESGHIELSLEPVNLIDLIDECFTLMTPVAERHGITISHEDMDLHYVRADRTRFKQVMLNLLSNAIKYNSEHGKVELTACVINDTRIRITVSDTGTGIAAEKQKKLFQPFNRLSAESSEIEGTGIGLTITKTLMELMGGSIGVDSKMGVGTHFWIELPLELIRPHQHEHQHHINNEQTEKQTSMIGNQHTVLYIEDNPANIKLVSNIFSKQQHIHLITAQSSELGLELALSYRPQLILLDINMPDMDGYQILSIIKADKHLKQLPVIAVTANAMPKDIKRGNEAGFSDYLTKPLNIPSFLSTINKYLK